MVEEELAALGALVWCGFCVLMLYVWMHTGGYVIRWLAGHIPNLSIPGDIPFVGGGSIFGWLIDALNGFDTAVQNDFYAYLDATKAVWNLWCSQAASFVANVTADIDWIADETGKALRVLRHSTIPALILGTFAPGSQLLGWLVSHVAAIVRASIQTATVAPKIITNTITRVEHLTRTVTKTVYAAVPAAVATAGAITLPRIRGLQRDVTGLEKWIRAHADALGLGVISGAVLYALGKVGLGSLRCSNTQKFNKGLCGLHPSWIEDLLLGAISIFGTLSIVSLAEQYQALIAGVAGEATHFWRADVEHVGADRQLGQTGL